MRKTIGYILIAAGLSAFALSYPAVRTAIKISLPAQIAEIYLTIGSIILLIIGAFISFKQKETPQEEEIPIYEGHGKHRKVVALQRLKK